MPTADVIDHLVLFATDRKCQSTKVGGCERGARFRITAPSGVSITFCTLHAIAELPVFEAFKECVIHDNGSVLPDCKNSREFLGALRAAHPELAEQIAKSPVAPSGATG